MIKTKIMANYKELQEIRKIAKGSWCFALVQGGKVTELPEECIPNGTRRMREDIIAKIDNAMAYEAGRNK